MIQKCLAKLSRNQNQFIYDAVSRQCISVATHRHGCCVLQRCLDHAVETQRVQLVKMVSHNALVLVQVKIWFVDFCRIRLGIMLYSISLIWMMLFAVRW